MAMEAVFFQIPSARNHARNYIAPFVDSITAILAVKFILATPERGKSEEYSEEPKEIIFGSVRVPSRLMTSRSTNPPLRSEQPSECNKSTFSSSSFQVEENRHSNYPPPFSPPQDTSMCNEQGDSQTSAIFSPPLEVIFVLRHNSIHDTISGGKVRFRNRSEPERNLNRTRVRRSGSANS
ncbi:hypothetical protein B0H14DRAFT_3125652, partial [Mycena olivaceomarginata]